MRDIRFRAWDGSKMYYFNNFEWTLDYNDISGWNVVKNLPPDQLKGRKWDAGESSATAEHFQLMQFTGLHDKNGKEIYEGDIFRVEEQAADDRMYYLVIHWIKEWCMFGCLTVGEYNDYLATGISAIDEPMFWTYTLEDTDSQKFFLCGNIHQNPKLIEP